MLTLRSRKRGEIENVFRRNFEHIRGDIKFCGRKSRAILILHSRFGIRREYNRRPTTEYVIKIQNFRIEYGGE